LEGFEKKWTFLYANTGRVAHYWKLEPGDYTFRLMACNADGVWNQTGASFTFTLKPFFYQTLFFKIGVLVFLLAILITAAVYIYRDALLQER
jgi:hypothetical protein